MDKIETYPKGQNNNRIDPRKNQSTERFIPSFKQRIKAKKLPKNAKPKELPKSVHYRLKINNNLFRASTISIKKLSFS